MMLFQERGLTMEARDLIHFIDIERRRQKLSQMAITDKAGSQDTGQQYYRMWASMDGKLSVVLRFLHALGLDLKVVKIDDE